MPFPPITGKHGPGVLNIPRAGDAVDPKRSPNATGSIAPGTGSVDPRRGAHVTGSIAPDAVHGVHGAVTGTRILRS